MKSSHSSPRRHVLAVGAVLALLAITATVILRFRDDEPVVTNTHVPASQPREEPQSGVALPTMADRSNVTPNEGTVSSSPSTLKERFAAASDYLEFARSVLEAAKSGDAEAQFLLYRTLEFCDNGYRFYFVRGNRRRTLDEAMQWASTRTPSAEPEEARDVYNKCHALMQPATSGEFGASDDWLEAATTNGHPVAQAVTAGDLLVSSTLLESSDDSAADAKQAMDHRERAVRLLSDALKSADPQVLWIIGDYQGALVKRDAWGSSWVWRMAACQRESCGAGASWHALYCRVDPRSLCMPGESGIDLIRRETGVHFPEYEERAKELNRLIDAGAWDEIKLIPTQSDTPVASE